MKREVRLVEAVDAFAKGATQLEALALTYGYDGGVAFDRVWEPLIEEVRPTCSVTPYLAR